jgi:hypothetical protein
VASVPLGLSLGVGLHAEERRGEVVDQRGNVAAHPVETFEAADDPYTITVEGQELSTPYGYDRGSNGGRTYPLVVIGKWGEGNDYFDEKIRKRYPAFYLVYQYNGESDGALLGDIIDAALAQGVRIDVNRILYTGFSAGGSGSFRLVRGLASKGKYFAGLNRVAGQSESVLAESAVGKTAIWLHQGLNDVPLRVETSRTLYRNLKQHPVNAGAVEIYVEDTVTFDGGPQPRKTWILEKDGVEVVRFSEYPTSAHDGNVGYADPYMFEWIFGRLIRANDKVE